jgi:chromate transporter
MKLVELALHFVLLSLVSIGGMLSVILEMRRYVVDVKHWMAPADFIQMFAVGQAAPGPNVLIAGLIGWKVAGATGALVALGAICGPAAIVAFWVAGVWERMKDSPWRAVAQRAMAPIVVGLVFSGGFVLATPGHAPEWRLWLIAAAGATGLLTSRLNPCGCSPPASAGCFSTGGSAAGGMASEPGAGGRGLLWPRPRAAASTCCSELAQRLSTIPRSTATRLTRCGSSIEASPGRGRVTLRWSAGEREVLRVDQPRRREWLPARARCAARAFRPVVLQQAPGLRDMPAGRPNA